MNYYEAAVLREEIVDTCEDLPESSIKITQLKEGLSSSSQSYWLHISNLSFNSRLCLQALVEKHHLSLEDQDGTTIIYKSVLASQT